MSINLINLLLIIIILLVLNYIKINNQKDELTNTVNTPCIRKPNDKIPIYGDIQYTTTNNYDNVDFDYDNEIIPDNYKNVTIKLSNLGPYNKPEYNKPEYNKPEYNNTFIKSNLNHAKSNNFELKDKDLLPSQQDIIYDSYKQFNQRSDADIYNPLVPTQIEYNERKIQDVYDQLINDPKKYEKEKKIKLNTNDKITGGFEGEKILSNLLWEYEEDNDGMSYDPTLSNLLSL